MNTQIELWWEVHAFLSAEAELLDANHFRAWLDLFADDARYWMPLRVTRSLSDTRKTFLGEGDHSYFDDDKEMLQIRIAKLETIGSWAEDPPSRTRHLFTNLRVESRDADHVLAHANVAVFRSRLASEEEWFFGRREDHLQRSGGSWSIHRRSIFLDTSVLRAKNLSILF